MDYVIALAIGLVIGVGYAVLGVRSPAPPVIALVGLLGMLSGEQLVPWVKAQWQAPSTEATTHVSAEKPSSSAKL